MYSDLGIKSFECRWGLRAQGCEIHQEEEKQESISFDSRLRGGGDQNEKLEASKENERAKERWIKRDIEKDVE